MYYTQSAYIEKDDTDLWFMSYVIGAFFTTFFVPVVIYVTQALVHQSLATPVQIWLASIGIPVFAFTTAICVEMFDKKLTNEDLSLWWKISWMSLLTWTWAGLLLSQHVYIPVIT